MSVQDDNIVLTHSHCQEGTVASCDVAADAALTDDQIRVNDVRLETENCLYRVSQPKEASYVESLGGFPLRKFFSMLNPLICQLRASPSYNLSFNHKRNVNYDENLVTSIKRQCTDRKSYANCLKLHSQTHGSKKPFVDENPSGCCNHDNQKSYGFACYMQDGNTQPWSEGLVRCDIRTKTKQQLEDHVQKYHTVKGITRKFESEQKLAFFFSSKQIKYDRDWTNRINFTTCKSMSGDRTHARPDFFLPSETARLNAVVLVGNDEMQHKYYQCEFERVFNIVNALEQTEDFHSVPIVYFRFNPHSYKRGNVLYDHPLSQAHEILWHTVQNFQPSQVKPGVNLVYIHYDCDDKGMLTLFEKEETNDFRRIFEDCVRLIV